MKKLYRGSCHCGAVRFEAELDLAETSKCNCSICTETRFWKAVIGTSSFRLQRGEDALSVYQFGGHNIRHFFCSRCGMKPFGRGYHEAIGDFVAVNIACLDDATDEELASARVIYQDGRHNRWESPPAETRYL
ncbi:MAG: GFA family protein [Bradyrhizobiaceae bacterium]|nr:GFA family protein [Bradyrhizobiaceae bacterium]